MEMNVKINCGVVVIRGGTWVVNKKNKKIEINRTKQSDVKQNISMSIIQYQKLYNSLQKSF